MDGERRGKEEEGQEEREERDREVAGYSCCMITPGMTGISQIQKQKKKSFFRNLELPAHNN